MNGYHMVHTMSDIILSFCKTRNNYLLCCALCLLGVRQRLMTRKLECCELLFVVKEVCWRCLLKPKQNDIFLLFIIVHRLSSCQIARSTYSESRHLVQIFGQLINGRCPVIMYKSRWEIGLLHWLIIFWNVSARPTTLEWIKNTVMKFVNGAKGSESKKCILIGGWITVVCMCGGN